MVDIYNGEICGLCFRDGQKKVEATHKVQEELPIGAPSTHELTQYVCCVHFEKIFGRHSHICAYRMRKKES
jgi:hypothetical protein